MKYFHIASLLLFTALIAGVSTAHAEKDFDYVNAEFQVYYNDKPSKAKNTLNISRENNQYQMDFKAKHMLGSMYHKTTFNWNNCESTPISSYNKVKAIGISKKQHVSYNHTTNTAKVSGSKDATLEIDENTNDGLSFFLEARCGLIKGETEFKYPIIKKAKLRTVKYQIVGHEKVKTALGTFDTIKIEKVRSNKKRKTILWIAPELDYMVVKLYHYENGMVSGSAVLKKLDYAIMDDNTLSEAL